MFCSQETDLAIRKLQPKETAKDRQVKHRVMTAKAQRSPVDRTSRYHEQLGELARECDAPVDEVIEEWSERAAAREYLGGVSRDVAEFLAMDDVRQRYRRGA